MTLRKRMMLSIGADVDPAEYDCSNEGSGTDREAQRLVPLRVLDQTAGERRSHQVSLSSNERGETSNKPTAQQCGNEERARRICGGKRQRANLCFHEWAEEHDDSPQRRESC